MSHSLDDLVPFGYSISSPGGTVSSPEPIKVTTVEAQRARDISRVLMAVDRLEGEYRLTFEPEVPNVLALDHESKWNKLDELCSQSRLLTDSFRGFSQALDTSLKKWKNSTKQVEDVISYLQKHVSEETRQLLSGCVIAIGTVDDASRNEHALCQRGLCTLGHSFNTEDVRRSQLLGLRPPRGQC